MHCWNRLHMANIHTFPPTTHKTKGHHHNHPDLPFNRRPSPPPRTTGNKVCTSETCRFGAVCTFAISGGSVGCSCSHMDNCTEAISNDVRKHVEKEEVCGSDLRMYPSTCHMRRRACQTQTDIRPRPKRMCKGGAVAIIIRVALYCCRLCPCCVQFCV